MVTPEKQESTSEAQVSGRMSPPSQLELLVEMAINGPMPGGCSKLLQRATSPDSGPYSSPVTAHVSHRAKKQGSL